MKHSIKSCFGAIVAVAVLAGCQTSAKQSIEVSAPAPVPEPIAAATSKPADKPNGPALASRHMIASANPLATEAGLEILRQGGSAIDAAIAAQMVLNLVEPQSSGIGGGGFLVHYAAGSGEIATYDGRETAPASANPYMFLDGQGKPRKFHDVVPGGLSVGVPGLLRMLETVHREHGKLPWKKLFDAAIRLASEGFPVSERLHKMIAEAKHIASFPKTAAYFHGDGGQAKPVGASLINEELSETFRLVADNGADAFYKGDIAEDIAKTVRASSLNPGAMTTADLAAYQAVKRDPVCLFYRIWMICGMGPPSSGGITTLQILGILQKFDLSKTGPDGGVPSLRAVHLITEAGRLAFADRDIYIADPDFIPVPVTGLLDPGYLESRAETISQTKSRGKASPGMPGTTSGLLLAPGDATEGVSTTHLSVIDGDGNAVSLTSSIENAFGSRLMVRGFLLNNQLTDFSFTPVSGGAPIANRPEPGKRPRSSMSPTLVFDGEGRVVMALGSPGGSRIIGYVAKTLIAALDWKLGVQKAIDLPNFTNRNGATELEAESGLESLGTALEAMGHEVRIVPLNSGLHAVTVTKEGIAGGADGRREGTAMGD